MNATEAIEYIHSVCWKGSIPGLGRTSYGATRWIGIGGFTMQPSEIAKFCLVFFLAGYLCDGDKLSKIKHILITLTLGGIYCVLIMLEPNMSITMCVAFTLIFMLFIGKFTRFIAWNLIYGLFQADVSSRVQFQENIKKPGCRNASWFFS